MNTFQGLETTQKEDVLQQPIAQSYQKFAHGIFLALTSSNAFIVYEKDYNKLVSETNFSQ